MTALWDNSFQIVDQPRGSMNAQIFNRQWCLLKWKLRLAKMAVAWSTAYQCHHPETIYFTHKKPCFFRNYSVISGCIIFDLSQPLHISLPAPSLSQKRAIWLKRNRKTTAICPLWKILAAQYQCWLHDYEAQEQTSFILRPALQKLKGWRCSCNILQVRGTQITLRKGFFFLKCRVVW